ncbi:MAG: GFA family protein [Tateyamaria sp.]|uniref:GFA family protein n=1 Tax=Tateyamaria sp. TaxID=1929288 RepID=UPI00329F2F19
MPSETVPEYTARCYCGASELTIQGPPETVAYCHCSDCRRWTGAPVAAFAAFSEGDLIAQMPRAYSPKGNVRRWVCETCGSPLGAAFDYLPDQIYVPLGIIDQADTLAPALHSHHAERLSWLHLADDLPRSDGTARADLKASST